MLHTITIILKEKYEIGRDPFNAPIYEYADTPAEGYLVAPLNPEAVMSAKQAKQWQHLGLKSDEGGVLLSQKSDEAKGRRFLRRLKATLCRNLHEVGMKSPPSLTYRMTPICRVNRVHRGAEPATDNRSVLFWVKYPSRAVSPSGYTVTPVNALRLMRSR